MAVEEEDVKDTWDDQEESDEGKSLFLQYLRTRFVSHND